MLNPLFLVLTFLLCTSHLKAIEMPASASPFDTYDLSLPWDVRDYQGQHIPIPVKTPNSQLIYVTGNLDASRNLQLDFEDSDKKSCVVPRNLRYNSESRREAVSLGNGKVVTTMLNNQVSRMNVISAALNVEWRVSIIDPRDCSYKHLVVASAGQSLIDVLPYEHSFDILLEDRDSSDGSPRTKVVRYNDAGEVQPFSTVIPGDDFLKLRMIKEHDPSAGYYYITPIRQQGSSILKKLNSNFEVVKSYQFQHSKYTTYDIDAYSFEHGKFSICYFDQENRKSLRCLVLDGELNDKLAEVRITYEHEVYNVLVWNVPTGGTAVLYANNNKGDNSDTVYLQYLSEDGKVGSPVEFGKVPRSIHYMYNYEMKDGSYCVSISSIDAVMTKYIKPLKA